MSSGLISPAFLAWWLWRTVYLFSVSRFERRCGLLSHWTLDLCFAKDFGLRARRPALPCLLGESHLSRVPTVLLSRTACCESVALIFA